MITKRETREAEAAGELEDQLEEEEEAQALRSIVSSSDCYDVRRLERISSDD